MIRLHLSSGTTDPLQILCLGCHADDIEIGCGGTVLRLVKEHPGCVIHWVVFSAIGARQEEAQHAASLFVPHANLRGPILGAFRDGFMPFEGFKIKELFEEFKQKIFPDLIFTHNRKDAHQDHRLIAELTWNTFRNHLIFEYEIPKYDGDLGQPGVFVPLEVDQYQKKVDYLMTAFRSQHAKRWFQPETFLSLMRLRGMESNSPGGYAEAFYCKKLVL
jgi:LmbE family N-acetylglucosaminyl deacetylase